MFGFVRKRKFVTRYGSFSSSAHTVMSCPSSSDGANMGLSPKSFPALAILNLHSHPSVHSNAIPCGGTGSFCAVPLLTMAPVKMFSMSVASVSWSFSWLRFLCLFATLKKNASISAPAIMTNIQWNCNSKPLFTILILLLFCLFLQVLA
ncbi:Uncharacterised protein [uncultured archaeon]|nr:Uncharacterised protein [uncultured archaeon]